MGLSDEEAPRSPSSYSARWRVPRANGSNSKLQSPNGHNDLTQTSTPASAGSMTTLNAAGTGGVGLSDPELSGTRRKKLDAINRLQNLGRVTF